MKLLRPGTAAAAGVSNAAEGTRNVSQAAGASVAAETAGASSSSRRSRKDKRDTAAKAAVERATPTADGEAPTDTGGPAPTFEEQEIQVLDALDNHCTLALDTYTKVCELGVW